ncbi:MAG: tetratricopeptide repeat protein [Chitinispirillaceae bacterium]
MKLLSKLGLSESEQKTVKKVSLYSSGACALIILLFWITSLFSLGSTNTDHKGFGPKLPLSKPELTSLDIEAHEFASKRYLQSGRPEKAIPHLQRILVSRKDDRGTLKQLAQAHLECGHFKQALSTIDYLFSQNEDSLSAFLYARKGAALYYMGQYAQSEAVLKKGLENFPGDPEILCFLGQVEVARGVPSSKAESLFLQALESDSTYSEARYQLARYYESLEEYLKARKLLLEVLRTEPLHVRSHSRLGMIYYYLGNGDLALKSYQTALALNPEDYNTRFNLGELFYTFYKDNRNALRQFTLALKINPAHSEANFKCGLICLENNMIKEAIRYFEASLNTDRRNTRKMLQLAAACERLGNRRKALKIYGQITEIDPLHTIATQKIRLLTVN